MPHGEVAYNYENKEISSIIRLNLIRDCCNLFNILWPDKGEKTFCFVYVL